MKRMRDGSYTVPHAFTVRPGDSLSTMLMARADAHRRGLGAPHHRQ